jgi:hypothetical protein
MATTSVAPVPRTGTRSSGVESAITLSADHSTTPSQPAGEAYADLTGREEDVEIGGDLLGGADRSAIPLALTWIEITGFVLATVEHIEAVVQKYDLAPSRALGITFDTLNSESASLRRIECNRRDAPVTNRAHEKEFTGLVTHEDRRYVRVQAKSFGQSAQGRESFVEAFTRERCRFRGDIDQALRREVEFADLGPYVAADAVHQIIGTEQLDPPRFGVEKADQRETEDHEQGHEDRGQGQV